MVKALPLDVTTNTLRFRQFDPKPCKRFRNKRFTKGVMGAICFTDVNGGKTQSVIFDRDEFNITEARKWLRDHDFISTQKRLNPSGYSRKSSGKSNSPLTWLLVIGGVIGLSILSNKVRY